ncbi:MAG: PspC domain-containing protein [Bacteroidales bacterium]|nr:PspC domain-containing protein [Bacteroidales bacterium]
MKKTINAGIGKRNFVIDEDAYARLDTFLNHFRARLNVGDKKEVMEDLEERIAELFTTETAGGASVVDINLVNKVIAEIGMPDGTDEYASAAGATTGTQAEPKPKKKLYRNPDEKFLGGVCGGLAAYFDTDPVLIRILFVALLICASAGFWAYLIFWIVTPNAVTPAQKCELRGLAPTMENLSKFTNNSSK